MEKQNVVSIWLAKFDSEIDFRNYIDENYNEIDGEMSSSFMKEFKISFYDNQFFEAEFVLDPSVQTLIEPLSYSSFFINSVSPIIKYNSVIAVYNFKYEKSVSETKNTKFIGSFSYEV